MSIVKTVPEVEDFGGQTKLQCYPFFLEDGQLANVSTDEIIQTEISIDPSESNSDIYPRLTSLSSADLLRDVVRVIIVPRRPKLHFKLPKSSSMFVPDSLKSLTTDPDMSSPTNISEEELDTSPDIEEPTDISDELKLNKDSLDSNSSLQEKQLSQEKAIVSQEKALVSEEKPVIPEEKSPSQDKHTSWSLTPPVVKTRKISEQSDTSEDQIKGVLKKKIPSYIDPEEDPALFPEEPGTPFKIKEKIVVCQEIQTILSVKPHILDGDEQAVVCTDLGVQTSVTCIPQNSVSDLLPKLKAYLVHEGVPLQARPVGTGDSVENHSVLDLIREIIDRAGREHLKMFEPVQTPNGSFTYERSITPTSTPDDAGDSFILEQEIELPEVRSSHSDINQESRTSSTSKKDCKCGSECKCVPVPIEIKIITESECVCKPCAEGVCQKKESVCPCVIGTKKTCDCPDEDCPCTLDRKAKCPCQKDDDMLEEDIIKCRCTIDRKAVCICPGRFRLPIKSPTEKCACSLDRNVKCTCDEKCSNAFKICPGAEEDIKICPGTQEDKKVCPAKEQDIEILKTCCDLKDCTCPIELQFPGTCKLPPVCFEEEVCCLVKDCTCVKELKTPGTCPGPQDFISKEICCLLQDCSCKKEMQTPGTCPESEDTKSRITETTYVKCPSDCDLRECLCKPGKHDPNCKAHLPKIIDSEQGDQIMDSESRAVRPGTKVTESKITKPKVTESGTIIPGVTDSKPLEPTVTGSRVIEPTVTPSKEIEPGITPSKIIEPGATPSKVLEPGVTPSKVMEPAVTPSKVMEPGVTPSKVLEPGVTPSKVMEPGVTPSKVMEPGVTPSKVIEPGVTSSKVMEPGVTPSKVFEPGVTPSKVLERGVTPSKVMEPGVTPSKVIEPGVTPSKVIAPKSTPSKETALKIIDSKVIEPIVTDSKVLSKLWGSEKHSAECDCCECKEKKVEKKASVCSCDECKCENLEGVQKTGSLCSCDVCVCPGNVSKEVIVAEEYSSICSCDSCKCEGKAKKYPSGCSCQECRCKEEMALRKSMEEKVKPEHPDGCTCGVCPTKEKKEDTKEIKVFMSCPRAAMLKKPKSCSCIKCTRDEKPLPDCTCTVCLCDKECTKDVPKVCRCPNCPVVLKKGACPCTNYEPKKKHKDNCLCGICERKRIEGSLSSKSITPRKKSVRLSEDISYTNISKSSVSSAKEHVTLKVFLDYITENLKKELENISKIKNLDKHDNYDLNIKIILDCPFMDGKPCTSCVIPTRKNMKEVPHSFQPLDNCKCASSENTTNIANLVSKIVCEDVVKNLEQYGHCLCHSEVKSKMNELFEPILPEELCKKCGKFMRDILKTDISIIQKSPVKYHENQVFTKSNNVVLSDLEKSRNLITRDVSDLRIISTMDEYEGLSNLGIEITPLAPTVTQDGFTFPLKVTLMGLENIRHHIPENRPTSSRSSRRPDMVYQRENDYTEPYMNNLCPEPCICPQTSQIYPRCPASCPGQVYQEDKAYTEPYVEQGYNKPRTNAEAQTVLALGSCMMSDSLNSLPETDTDYDTCDEYGMDSSRSRICSARTSNYGTPRLNQDNENTCAANRRSDAKRFPPRPEMDQLDRDLYVQDTKVSRGQCVCGLTDDLCKCRSPCPSKDSPKEIETPKPPAYMCNCGTCDYLSPPREYYPYPIPLKKRSSPCLCSKTPSKPSSSAGSRSVKTDSTLCFCDKGTSPRKSESESPVTPSRSPAKTSSQTKTVSSSSNKVELFDKTYENLCATCKAIINQGKMDVKTEAKPTITVSPDTLSKGDMPSCNCPSSAKLLSSRSHKTDASCSCTPDTLTSPCNCPDGVQLISERSKKSDGTCSCSTKSKSIDTASPCNCPSETQLTSTRTSKSDTSCTCSAKRKSSGSKTSCNCPSGVQLSMERPSKSDVTCSCSPDKSISDSPKKLSEGILKLSKSDERRFVSVSPPICTCPGAQEPKMATVGTCTSSEFLSVKFSPSRSPQSCSCAVLRRRPSITSSIGPPKLASAMFSPVSEKMVSSCTCKFDCTIKRMSLPREPQELDTSCACSPKKSRSKQSISLGSEGDPACIKQSCQYVTSLTYDPSAEKWSIKDRSKGKYIDKNLKMTASNSAPNLEAKKPTPPTKLSCGCDKIISSDSVTSIKQDPVVSAMLACEAEMKPIKQALNTVRSKLRNLNMPELDCILATKPIPEIPDRSESNAGQSSFASFKFGPGGPKKVKSILKIQDPFGPNPQIVSQRRYICDPYSQEPYELPISNNRPPFSANLPIRNIQGSFGTPIQYDLPVSGRSRVSFDGKKPYRQYDQPQESPRSNVYTQGPYDSNNYRSRSRVSFDSSIGAPASYNPTIPPPDAYVRTKLRSQKTTTRPQENICFCNSSDNRYQTTRYDYSQPEPYFIEEESATTMHSKTKFKLSRESEPRSGLSSRNDSTRCPYPPPNCQEPRVICPFPAPNCQEATKDTEILLSNQRQEAKRIKCPYPAPNCQDSKEDVFVPQNLDNKRVPCPYPAPNCQEPKKISSRAQNRIPCPYPTPNCQDAETIDSRSYGNTESVYDTSEEEAFDSEEGAYSKTTHSQRSSCSLDSCPYVKEKKSREKTNPPQVSSSQCPFLEAMKSFMNVDEKTAKKSRESSYDFAGSGLENMHVKLRIRPNKCKKSKYSS